MDKQGMGGRLPLKPDAVAALGLTVVALGLAVAFAVAKDGDPCVAMGLLYGSLIAVALAIGVVVEGRVLGSGAPLSARSFVPIAAALAVSALIVLMGYADVTGLAENRATRLTSGETSEPEVTALKAYDDGRFLHVKDADTYTALTENGEEVEIPVASSFTVDPTDESGRIEMTETKVADETYAETGWLSRAVYGPEAIVGSTDAEPETSMMVFVPELPMPDGFDEGFAAGNGDAQK